MRCVYSGLFWLAALTATLISNSVIAQNESFPYQARVVVDELYVRSGSGESWHATQRLTRDAIVTVRRHDPGGWYQITPPEGSFSWVPSRFVNRLSEKEGEIKENNVVAFVGSDFGDETTVWQRSLPSGEKVTIIGERDIDTLSGRQHMFQILPPKLEWRWIPGSGVVPVDEKRRRELDQDPYATPSNAARKNAPGVVANQQGGVSDVPAVSPDSQLARLQQIRREQKELADADRQFREMITKDPAQWSLDQIESQYQRLQKSATYKPVAGQIDLRYPAIERYRQRQAEFLDFKRLTSQTEHRDAELLAQLKNGRSASLATIVQADSLPDSNFNALPASETVVSEFPGDAFSSETSTTDSLLPGTTVPVEIMNGTDTLTPVPQQMIPGSDAGVPQETPSSVQITPAEADHFAAFAAENFAVDNSSESVRVTPASYASTELPADAESSGSSVPETASEPSDGVEVQNSLFASGEIAPRETPGVSAAPIDRQNPRARFVGAGIVQRSPASKGESPFVLTTPAGRILARLKPAEDVRIEAYVGQAVGIQGSRWFSEDAKTDIIEVVGLETVRIRSENQ